VLNYSLTLVGYNLNYYYSALKFIITQHGHLKIKCKAWNF